MAKSFMTYGVLASIKYGNLICGQLWTQKHSLHPFKLFPRDVSLKNPVLSPYTRKWFATLSLWHFNHADRKFKVRCKNYNRYNLQFIEKLIIPGLQSIVKNQKACFFQIPQQILKCHTGQQKSIAEGFGILIYSNNSAF